MKVTLISTSFAVVVGQDVFLSKQEQSFELASAAPTKHQCVQNCLDSDKVAHFKNCNHDGSDTCAKSKCCEVEGNTCFVKNAYWSACTKACKKGVKDSKGEMWDCTAMSPSNPTTLRTCAEGCFGSELQSLLESPQNTTTEIRDAPLALTQKATGDWDCSAYTDVVACIEAHNKFSDPALVKIWAKTCTDNCPAAKPVVCPKPTFTACVQTCDDESRAPEHGDKCQHDGATNCLSSRCCQNPSDKCYTKNQYWAACVPSCPKGKPNPVDNQIWSCNSLAPKTVIDPFLYRKCVSTCVAQC